ncbi:MAG: hypothetical protein ACT4OO_07730 [Nitrospiraceae bacterium]
MGCSQEAAILKSEPIPPAAPADGQQGDRQILAGAWEYEEEGTVFVINLDHQGNGKYAWKDGRFETMGLSNHTWRGMWFQNENDREGGFEVTLADDYSKGEGLWWYSRIGNDTSPGQKGGAFHLSRASVNKSRDTPPAP